MKLKAVTTVAVLSILAVSPLFAGAMFKVCKEYVQIRPDVDNCFKTTSPDNKRGSGFLKCGPPNDFYDPGYQGCTPSVCKGLTFMKGFCIENNKWWGYCDDSKEVGVALVYQLVGVCNQAYKPDGSKELFYFPCTNMRKGDQVTKYSTMCNEK